MGCEPLLAALNEHEASVLADCASSMSGGNHAINFGSNLTHQVLARDFIEISAVAVLPGPGPV